MKHKLLLLYSWFVWLITFFMPDMKMTMRFRGWLYFLPFKSLSKNIQVANTARLIGLENINLGSDVYIASGVVINARGKVFLSDQVMIGHETIVVAGNHTKLNGSFRFGPSVAGDIHIGFGSWIGGNCTITAGSLIGTGVLVGANSLVRGELNSDSFYAGVPVKLIR
ncbi:acyltransferase [Aeromonas veronii]|uniref:acyltransferase n=1 Tax=Aeromonas veronii TaxID=654 RepID=UPI003B9EC8A4